MGLLYVLIIAVVYFIPGVIATQRKHKNANAITMLNLLLGWTVLGWVASLVWAMTDPGIPPKQKAA